HYAEQAAGVYSPASQKLALNHYCEKALASWDIIDLSNLPEGDINIATQKILLRQLYIPLRVKVPKKNDKGEYDDELDRLEKQRELSRQRGAGHLADKENEVNNHSEYLARVGERLNSYHRLVVLGDPGGGKTTMLRWMATAYLLRYNDIGAFSQIPNAHTLPDRQWIPVLIRCRDLGDADLCRCFSDFLTQHLRKTELLPSEAEVMCAVILDRIAKGEALLLIDGLDEITNPQVRMMFCQELERTAARYPDLHIVVTSRIVGYRDMPYRMESGFVHSIISELNREDKDLFAKRWIEVTEQHLSDSEKGIHAEELIEALHSSDRIERLTDNPMLLTTLALVKRKVGKLPNRRNKLYNEAVSVLLNWNPRHYKIIEEDEAFPQLEYLAYEMCQRGVQRMTYDDVLGLLERLRAEYPNIRAIRRNSPQTFLEHLEARSSILIKSGSIWQSQSTCEKPVWEFRHLTFQEYLAARALLEGHYIGHDKQRALAERVAPLAGVVETSKHCLADPEDEQEVEVSESWREVLRLLVNDCKDDQVDDIILAILNPLSGEETAKTCRPRAGLAALCLADEPNVSEEAARQVLTEFARNVSEGDGIGHEKTSFDSIAIEVSGSIWAPIMQECLIDECRKHTDLRPNLGGIIGLSDVKYWTNTNHVSRKYFTDLLQKFQNKKRDEAISAAFITMQAAFDQKIVLIQGLVEALFAMLREGSLECFAASWALSWLNRGPRQQKNRKLFWSPNTEELCILITVLENAPADEKDIRKYLKNIITNIDHDRLKNDAKPILLSSLSSKDPDVKYAVLKALENIKDSCPIEPFLNLLRDPIYDVRCALASALGKSHNSLAYTPLLSLLKDDNIQVKRAAMRSLGILGNPEAIDPLIELLNDADVDERSIIAEALGKFRDKRPLEPLLTLLKDENTQVQCASARGLGTLGYIEAVGQLTDKLTNSNASVRKAAAEALGKLKDKRPLESLLTLLEDENTGVQYAAALAIASLDVSEAVEPLLNKLNSTNPNIQLAAAEALRESKDARIVEPIINLI
ncbi:NACHT domain-containing protein, partial [bacterium]|nr:NACHT domain-containing protein [bacterium]